jgi:putative hydroxymethylpyrimidine transport system permease protein
MKIILRGLLVTAGLICLWQCIVMIFQLPPYILPAPYAVLKTLISHQQLILHESLVTIIETLAGLILGILFGCCTALLMAYLRSARQWLLPVLLISQALPTFAIAPLLVIWLGFGIASKIIITILMLFYPVTSAFFDGLQRTPPGWLDLAATMNASKWRVFWQIRIPAALPALASGVRVAAAIAPIGAVVGEWVGSSHGLGYMMLTANARMQIDLMFAALFSIIVFSLLLYYVVGKILSLLIRWQPEG